MATRGGIRLQPSNLWRVALAIVFLAALAVRLYGIDWDEGTDLHPDELFITKFVLSDRIRLDWPVDFARLLDPATSGLNPRSADPATGEFREFAYGALPLWVTDATGWLLSRLTGTDWNSTERTYLVGRALSALFGALTILPVAALGGAAGGRAVGLLASLSGTYKSSFKGQGLTFREVRPYQAGDDVRTIDWNVSARMNETFV
mgnify:CR=1 FL=1